MSARNTSRSRWLTRGMSCKRWRSMLRMARHDIRLPENGEALYVEAQYAPIWESWFDRYFNSNLLEHWDLKQRRRSDFYKIRITVRRSIFRACRELHTRKAASAAVSAFASNLAALYPTQTPSLSPQMLHSTYQPNPIEVSEVVSRLQSALSNLGDEALTYIAHNPLTQRDMTGPIDTTFGGPGDQQIPPPKLSESSRSSNQHACIDCSGYDFDSHCTCSCVAVNTNVDQLHDGHPHKRFVTSYGKTTWPSAYQQSHRSQDVEQDEPGGCSDFGTESSGEASEMLQSLGRSVNRPTTGAESEINTAARRNSRVIVTLQPTSMFPEVEHLPGNQPEITIITSTANSKQSRLLDTTRTAPMVPTNSIGNRFEFMKGFALSRTVARTAVTVSAGVLSSCIAHKLYPELTAGILEQGRAVLECLF